MKAVVCKGHAAGLSCFAVIACRFFPDHPSMMSVGCFPPPAPHDERPQQASQQSAHLFEGCRIHQDEAHELSSLFTISFISQLISLAILAQLQQWLMQQLTCQ